MQGQATRVPVHLATTHNHPPARQHPPHHNQMRRLSVEGITVLQGERTPTVSVVFGLDGEVAACVADVSLLERALTPALLREARLAAALAAAPLLLLDGNLAPAAIEASGWCAHAPRSPDCPCACLPATLLSCAVRATLGRRRPQSRPPPPACPPGLSLCRRRRRLERLVR